MKKLILLIILAFLGYETAAQVSYQVLRNTDLPSNANFGRAVTISENYLAVSSTHHDEKGQVYIYKIFADSYILTQILSPDEVTDTELFGADMDMTDNHLVVGARGSNSNSDIGKAYIFERQGEDWLLQKILYENQDSSNFGSLVKIEGEKILVTASTESGNFPFGLGIVEVHELIDGDWANTHYIESPEPHVYSLGRGVGVNGEWMAISGFLSSSQLGNAQIKVAVYLYKFENNSWNLKQKFYHEPMDSWSLHSPGHNIALSKNQLIFSSWIVGPSNNQDTEYQQAPMIYNLVDDVWIHSQSLTVDHIENNNLGRRVSMNNNFAFVSVSDNYYLQNDNIDSNAILVFDISDPNNWELVADLPFEYNSSLHNFHFSLDLNESFGAASAAFQPTKHGEVYIFNLKEPVNTANLIAQEDISIYPIPSSDILNIEYQKSLIIEYTIFSPSGQIKRSSNEFKTNRLDINISNFSQGNYWVKVITEDGYLYKQISKI